MWLCSAPTWGEANWSKPQQSIKFVQMNMDFLVLVLLPAVALIAFICSFKITATTENIPCCFLLNLFLADSVYVADDFVLLNSSWCSVRRTNFFLLLPLCISLMGTMSHDYIRNEQRSAATLKILRWEVSWTVCHYDAATASAELWLKFWSSNAQRLCAN